MSSHAHATAAAHTAWFHCFAGTAGDMTLGALVHAGADPLMVAAVIGQLDLQGYALSFEPVMRCGLAATHAVVAVHSHDPHAAHEHDHHHTTTTHVGHRPYRAIRELIDRAELPPRIAERAQRTFRLLAEVEGVMHRQPADEVEFHEVGSVDAIVDIVGVCAALESLGVDRIVCSPITVGQGTVHAAHGELPNPAPAVVELLARRNAPSRGVGEPKELATPTGVALMCALADEFGPMPALQVAAVGYGAGTADTPGRPNVVQVVLGVEAEVGAAAGSGQPMQLFEANLDDVTGEVLAHTISALLAAGANDAWVTPIVMKKGRPAHTVHALCDPALAAPVSATLLRETGTLGLRGSLVERWPQARQGNSVVIDGHTVRIKVAGTGVHGRIKVEHDDAAAAAAALGRPLREVLDDAAALARRTALEASQ
jgi:pyridinium-3,5-bisthiocarboxylic acid mononucleotide nickel chelatase